MLVVVREHSPANEMYFLTRGKAAVLQKSKQVFVLEAGSYFGEIGCIIDAVQTYQNGGNKERSILRALET